MAATPFVSAMACVNSVGRSVAGGCWGRSALGARVLGETARAGGAPLAAPGVGRAASGGEPAAWPGPPGPGLPRRKARTGGQIAEMGFVSMASREMTR
jgi:hypothetical protein